MYQLWLINITQEEFDFVTGMASDATRLCSIVVDQAARDILAFRIDNSDHCAALEFPTNFGDTDR